MRAESVSLRRRGNGTTPVGESYLQMMEALAPLTGQVFLDAFAAQLADRLSLDRVYVIDLLADGRAMLATGGDASNNGPFLLGGAAMAVLSEDTVATGEGASRRFPSDPRVDGCEAFFGVTLKSASGVPIGLLAAMNESPVLEAAAVAPALAQMAPRVAAELERRQQEESLRHSVARLSALTEASRDVLYFQRCLPEPAFEYISPAVEELTGYPPESFLADAGLLERLVETQGEDRGAGPEGALARLSRADGGECWVELRQSAVYDQGDEVTAICGAIRDVTQRVDASRALQDNQQHRRALMDALPDLVFRLDMSGTVRDYLPGELTRTFDVAKVDLVGRNIREILPASMWAPMMRLAQLAVTSRRLERTELEVHAAALARATTYEIRSIPFAETEAVLILRDFGSIGGRHEPEVVQHDEPDARMDRRHAGPYDLTFRELAVLNLVAAGQADKQIAETLGISIYTVNKHVGNILGKMSASSRTEAGVRAIRENLVG